MTATIKIKPRDPKGAPVIDPTTGKPVPAKGIEVDASNPYWKRRLLPQGRGQLSEMVLADGQASDTTAPRSAATTEPTPSDKPASKPAKADKPATAQEK